MEALVINHRNPKRILNDLPDEILLHILTFVPTLEAVQTSVISRKWRSLWSRLRCLKFSFEHFLLNYPLSDDDNSDFFAGFVDRVLIARPHFPKLDLFSLSFIYDDRFGIQVESWLRHAVKHLHAREIHVNLCFAPEYHHYPTAIDSNQMYDFPFAALRNGAVEVLRLKHVDLTLPESMAAMNLASLISMCLNEVYLTDQMVEDLILGCPNLEELGLLNCCGMDKLKICSKRLNKAYFYDVDKISKIEINCPNLCSLSLDNFRFKKFVMRSAPALVVFSVNIERILKEDYGLWSRTVRMLEHAPNVKHLNLQNWWFKFLEPNDSFPKSFRFLNLNHLELQTGYTLGDLVGLAALLQLSPNLKIMTLNYVNNNVEDGVLPDEFADKPNEFCMPNLKQITMKSYSGSDGEINFVETLKKNGVVLEKIVIHHVKVGDKLFSPVVINRVP